MQRLLLFGLLVISAYAAAPSIEQLKTRFLEGTQFQPAFDISGDWKFCVITQTGLNVHIRWTGNGRPDATGQFIAPDKIQITFPDDNTYTAVVTATHLDWSNNTDWYRDAAPTKQVPDAALGQWSIISNGWPGQLILTRDGNTDNIKGTIQYHNSQVATGSSLLALETLSQITFTKRYGGLYIRFLRGGSSQWYFALYDQNYENINGHFESGGAIYSFDATRAGEPRYSSGVDNALLGGSWGITSNGWPGSLSFTSTTAGTIQYDSNQSPSGYEGTVESINNIVFVYLFNTWYVKFYRPAATQWYWALVEKNLKQLHGHFTHGGGAYEFDGTRAAPLPQTTACPVPAFFAGDYAILSNGWAGTLSLPGDFVFGKAVITYDDSRLPSTKSLPTEPITAVLPLRKYDSWFIYFQRPKASQSYWAIFDQSTQSLHGHFTSGGGVYEFVAQKVSPPPTYGGPDLPPPPPPSEGVYQPPTYDQPPQSYTPPSNNYY